MRIRRPLLLPFSPLFWCATVVRGFLYDAGILKSEEISVPVISVGNISAGGVGKTPFVAMTARLLQGLGKRVAIISRGYGRRSKGFLVVSDGSRRTVDARKAGDEPAELADALDGVIVAVGERRVEAAQEVVRRFHPDAIVLDDGFQHRAIGRSLDVVLMTKDDVENGDVLLPAGNRRETSSSLRRADCVVVTHCNEMEDFRRSADLLSRFGKPVFGVTVEPRGLRRLGNPGTADAEVPSGGKVLLFSGLGSPEAFERSVASLGYEMVRHLRYADHHWYGDEDLEEIGRMFRGLKADLMVTTRKDAARLSGERAEKFLGESPVFALTVGQMFVSGEKEFRDMLSAALSVGK